MEQKTSVVEIEMVEVILDGNDPSTNEPVIESLEPKLEGAPASNAGQFMETARQRWRTLTAKHKHHLKIAGSMLLFGLYNVYLIASIVYANSRDMVYDFSDGIGFLIVLTSVAYICLFYFRIIKPFWGKAIHARLLKPAAQVCNQLQRHRWFPLGFGLVLATSLAIFLAIDTANDRKRLSSFLGLLLFILLGWIFSKHPSKVAWKQVIVGTGMQFIFGLIVLRWNLGRKIIDTIGQKITIFLSYTNEGSGFVYGFLVSDDNSANIPLGFIFAFKILSVAFFFSFTVNILYYYGVMQWLVEKIGWLLRVTVGTTPAESVNAAANIFLGFVEAPLVIQPFLADMTNSELHAVMTGGFATIAGTVLAAFINFGIDAGHLLSASLMSAPAALAFSKLVYPETEKSQTQTHDIKLEKSKEANALDAAAQGASNAVMLVANIIANLISFLAFVAFLNGAVSWLAGLVGAPFITFEYIFSKLFIPIAWMMGVPNDECDLVGGLIAVKTIVNEFAAYAKLSELIRANSISKRSATIATYALCGFSNPGSIGAAIAGMGTLAPSRKSDFARVAFRAFVAGNVACFMTACIAGTLIDTTGVESFVNSAMAAI